MKKYKNILLGCSPNTLPRAAGLKASMRVNLSAEPTPILKTRPDTLGLAPRTGLLIVLVVVLIIIFTPVFGGFYELIIGRKISTWFLGPTNPQYIEGFFVAYAFFVTLFITLFGGKNKNKLLEIALGIIFLLDIFLAAWEGLIINIGVALVAWLLARAVILLLSFNSRTKK